MGGQKPDMTCYEYEGSFMHVCDNGVKVSFAQLRHF